MSYISAENALDNLQEREDAVRDTAAVFDKDIAKLQETYSLPADKNQWARVFATRLASVNKEYRQKVKYDLQNAGHNLKHLYSEGGDGDGPNTSSAMQLLVSTIVASLRANRRMNTLLEECTARYDQLVLQGRLALVDRVFLRKSLPDLVRCRRELNAKAREVQDQFASLKPALYVIAYEDDSKHSQQMLSARKLTKGHVEQKARSPFEVLLALSQERSEVLEDSMKLAFDHGVAWCSLPDEQLAIEEHDRELAVYEDLCDRIRTRKLVHDISLLLIRDLEATALATPATLSGIDGKEVPVSLLTKAFDGYERIWASCTEMLQLSEPIVETLAEYVQVLRSSHILVSAFSS